MDSVHSIGCYYGFGRRDNHQCKARCKVVELQYP